MASTGTARRRRHDAAVDAQAGSLYGRQPRVRSGPPPRRRTMTPTPVAGRSPIDHARHRADKRVHSLTHTHTLSHMESEPANANGPDRVDRAVAGESAPLAGHTAAGHRAHRDDPLALLLDREHMLAVFRRELPRLSD